MSRDNVKIIARMLDESQRRPDALYEILDDEVEWETGALVFPDHRSTRGPESVREFFRRWVGTFADWGFEAEELIDAGDAVVVRIHQWGRGKGSGAIVEGRFWQVWRMRDGKVIRTTHHLEKEEALQAAGLSE